MTLEKLSAITLQSYENLLHAIKNMIDFESDENFIDSITNIGSIINNINENYLIPELQKQLPIEIKVNQ